LQLSAPYLRLGLVRAAGHDLSHRARKENGIRPPGLPHGIGLFCAGS
jgi:hypothetical protein